MKRFSCFLLLALSFQLQGQISDHFDDMNFRNPTWSGDTLHFIHKAEGIIQLNANEAGSSFIYIPHSLSDTTEISLFFEMDFAASNRNQLSLYLFIDTPFLEVANGYKISIGETGSDDNIELYALRDGIDSLIAEGTKGEFGTDPAKADLYCTIIGNNLQINTDIEGDVSTFSTIIDETSLDSEGYFGIECRYTSTRKDKFYFDNFYSGPPIPDTLPPYIQEITVGDEFLVLGLSERIETATLKPGDFSVRPDIGSSTVLSWDQASLPA